MGRTVTASSGGVRPMWRIDGRGALGLVDEPDLKDYVTPPRGTRGRFMLSGISESFTMKSEQYGESTNVELEFLIEKTANPDFKWAEGKRFLQLVSLKTGPKSTLGMLLGALRGSPTTPGEDVDIDAFIGTSFISTATLVESTTGRQRSGVSVEGIEAGSVKPPTTLRAPAPVAAGGGATTDDEDDPFADEGLL